MSSATTAESDVIRIGQIEIRYLLHGADTDGRLATFAVTVPSNVRVPAPHRHLTYDESVVGLAGTCTFIVDGIEHRLAAGQALFIRRGAVHQFINRDTETARFIATVTPGVLRAEYFREIAAVVNAGGPPNLARIAEIMARHGLEAV